MITWYFWPGNAAACRFTAAASHSSANFCNKCFLTVGLVNEHISSYSACLSALANPSCFLIMDIDCLPKNWEGKASFHSVQSPSSALLLIRPSFFLPVLESVYQYWPPCSASLMAEPKGLSGSFLISFSTSILGVPRFLLVLNITSTPSGMSSEYTAIPFM